MSDKSINEIMSNHIEQKHGIKIDLDFKSVFTKGVKDINYLKIDFFTDGSKGKPNNSLLIPKNSKFFKKFLGISNEFVKENF